MTRLTYYCPPKIAKFASKAADEWNNAMYGLVALRPVEAGAANIHIEWGKIDNEKFPKRIAQCNRDAVDTWRITLSDKIRWAISRWSRFIGHGEDVTSTLLHEFGHVFDLPHAANPTFVMSEKIPRVTSMSPNEKTLYRKKFMEGNPLD
jgi:hypothetical protein